MDNELLELSSDSFDNIQDVYDNMTDVLSKNGYTFASIETLIPGYTEINKLLYEKTNAIISKLYDTIRLDIKSYTTAQEFSQILIEKSTSALEVYMLTMKDVDKRCLPLYLIIGLHICKNYMDLGTAQLLKNITYEFPFLVTSAIAYASMSDKKFEA